jgi:hypothetical protein
MSAGLDPMSAGLDRAGFAARDRIVARIASSGADVLAVGAGAGCGKTTLFCRGRGA